jgi:hypothetical protein
MKTALNNCPLVGFWEFFRHAPGVSDTQIEAGDNPTENLGFTRTFDPRPVRNRF